MHVFPHSHITLHGVAKERIPLSRPDWPCTEHTGVWLRTVPQGLSGFPVSHTWDHATGNTMNLHRATSSDPYTITLDLHAKGRRVAEDVYRFLSACGDGTRPVAISTRSDWHGYRWVHMYLSEVSDINWFDSPDTSEYAQFSVSFEAGYPRFRRFTEERTITADTWANYAGTKKFSMRVDGTAPIWPTITVTGQYDTLQIRLTDNDLWQNLPYRLGGWKVVTDPAYRSVTTLSGLTNFGEHLVPFWPEPLAVANNIATLQVDLANPAPDFMLTVTFRPEDLRAW